MKLIILIGPHAVGKMTVGQELEKVSGYKLFHNHMTIDMVAPFFSYGTPEGRRLVGQLRQAFFEAFAQSDQAGYVFTFVWAFEDPTEEKYIQGITDQFEEKGHKVYWIELEAGLDERIKRNTTANRLAHKPTKRDLIWSEANLKKANQDHRLNSDPGEISRRHYLKIKTSALPAVKAAQLIWDFVRE